MLWIILCFTAGLGAIIIAGIEIINGQTVSPYVASVLSGIIAHAFTIGGSINTSTQLENVQDKAMSAAQSIQNASSQNVSGN